MMYYSILASFCLLGMASSQSINMPYKHEITACLTKDQNLKMECTFTPVKQTNATCTYEVEKKVVATTGSLTVDPSFKGRGKVEISKNVCMLTLTGVADDKPKLYNCTIQQDTSNATQGLLVEKKSLNACSAGNTLMHGGVILLFAFVLPLLSGML